MPCAFGSCNYNAQTKRAIILHFDWLVAPGACFFSGGLYFEKGGAGKPERLQSAKPK